MPCTAHVHAANMRRDATRCTWQGYSRERGGGGGRAAALLRNKPSIQPSATVVISVINQSHAAATMSMHGAVQKQQPGVAQWAKS